MTLGFRPEALERVGPDDPGFDVVVDVVEELGSDAFVYGTITDSQLAQSLHGAAGSAVVARVDPRRPPAKGAQVRFGIRHAEHHLFSATTGLRLPE